MSAKHASVLFAVAGVAGAGIGFTGCSSSDSGAREMVVGIDAGVDATTGQDAGSAPGQDASGGSPGDATTGTDSPAVVSSCSYPGPNDPPAGRRVYNGGIAGQTCPQILETTTFPNNSWFSYIDPVNDAGVIGSFVHSAQKGNGCDGPNDCAFHASASGVAGYGAGVGFTLAANGIFDAMAKGYTGLRLWIKGTTTGTRKSQYALGPNTVHVKFLTGFLDGSTVDPRNGDDYGSYCASDLDGGAGGWIECPIPFSLLARDGFRSVDAGAPDPATDTFDPQDLVKIQLEFSAYTPPADSGTEQSVSFDMWIDDIAFF